ncbi:MAG: MipA/OmpV family protein [Pseudomonadota bacterium]|nr:MipA/OmpV family protein [Pseudomonadota bacterium]
MKQMKLLKTSAALLACSFAVSPVLAYEEISDTVHGGAGGGFVGLGVAVSPDYEGGNDYEAVPAPFGRYNWASGRSVSLGGTGGSEKAARLAANIISTEQSTVWKFGPLLQYRLKRDDNVDNKKVSRMKEVDAETELGAFLGFKSGALMAAVGYVTDVSSESDGSLWYLKGGYDLPVNQKFSMNVGVHLTYADDDYMDTYFGVSRKDSARSGLPQYTASSGFKDTGLALTGTYQFNQKWGMLGNVSWTRMLNDAEDSPLVDGSRGQGDKNVYAAVVAVTYAF